MYITIFGRGKYSPSSLYNMNGVGVYVTMVDGIDNYNRPARVSGVYYSRWPGNARPRQARLGGTCYIWGVLNRTILYWSLVSRLVVHWAGNFSARAIGRSGWRSMQPSLLHVPPDRVSMSHGSRGDASSTRAEVPA